MTSSRTLKDIENELLVISDHSNAVGYKRNEADMCVVCELADALRDAIVEYQVRVDLETPGKPSELFADAANSLPNRRKYMIRIVD